MQPQKTTLFLVLPLLALCKPGNCSNYPIREISYRGEAAWDKGHGISSTADEYSYQRIYYTAPN